MLERVFPGLCNSKPDTSYSLDAVSHGRLRKCRHHANLSSRWRYMVLAGNKFFWIWYIEFQYCLYNDNNWHQ